MRRGGKRDGSGDDPAYGDHDRDRDAGGDRSRMDDVSRVVDVFEVDEPATVRVGRFRATRVFDPKARLSDSPKAGECYEPIMCK